MPRHVAIIMDGNGRWARSQKQFRAAGHQAGADTFERIVEYVASSTSIQYLTAYGFAINNNGRDPDEVAFINATACALARKLAPKLKANGLRTRAVGNLSDERMPKDLQEAIFDLMAETASGKGLKLQIAWNYSGFDEILRAQECGVDITCLYDTMLDARDVPKIDLIIRTGADCGVGANYRPGDFFPLLGANAVLVPLTHMWPEFTPEHLEHACDIWRNEPHLNGGQRPELIRASA